MFFMSVFIESQNLHQAYLFTPGLILFVQNQSRGVLYLKGYLIVFPKIFEMDVANFSADFHSKKQFFCAAGRFSEDF